MVSGEPLAGRPHGLGKSDRLRQAIEASVVRMREIAKLQQNFGSRIWFGIRRGRSTFSSLHDSHFEDRKSTRLNSSHITISYAVFCLKKKRTSKSTSCW